MDIIVYPLALLLVLGAAAAKREFIPHAAGVAAILVLFNAFTKSSKSPPTIISYMIINRLQESPKLRKVLKPDIYQNFELVEKTVISHNTASYSLLTAEM